MYIYIDSSNSTPYFDDNTVTSFRIKLPKQLKLYGRWEVALVEIDLPSLAANYDTDYITVNTSLCTESVINGGLRPMLRRLYRDQLRHGRIITFSKPYYVPVNADEVDVIAIYLIDASNGKPAFLTQQLYCTLHVRPCRQAI